MTADERIAQLEVRIGELEDFVLEEKDKREELACELEKIRASSSDKLTICGIIVAVAIGLIQIVIGLLSLLK